MLDFLELEETVGQFWHRLVGRAVTYPRYPELGVSLDEVRGSLAVFFRGLGGEAGVQLAGTAARASSHRLNFLQRLGVTEERLEQPGRDAATLFLPPRIELFPSSNLNRSLYLWLAAYFAHVPTTPILEPDPLRRDLLILRRVQETVAAVLTACPGLAGMYKELCAAMGEARPQRPLPATESRVEHMILSMLRDGSAFPIDAALPQQAPAGYQPFLPVPLWGDTWARETGASNRNSDEPAGPSDLAASDTRKRFAARREADQAQRSDPFILNRFEKILAMAEMVNVNRPSDDDDDENAEKALDEMEEIPLSRHKGKPATKLKFDLDLPPEAVDTACLTADLTYPEWDYTRKAYLPNHCRVLAAPTSEQGEAWEADDEARRMIRRVRRQFEALRPKHEVLRAQPDGEELDIDALVRARSDLLSGGCGSDRVHLASKRQAHDLAVTLLVDVSLSTDAWIDNRRVLDVEKEALLVLAHGMAACGDSHSILTFTSRRRSWVRVETVKDFDEPMSQAVVRRISALKPGYYTRIGTGIRHATAKLAERPNRQRLLLVLTDGKPNDIDYYEGRFGIEDTRRAVMEARRAGITVFGVTVDREAQSYFPTLFGRGGYSIVGQVAKLPSALPAIYRHLVR
ncbi:nitric oxide reductase activation protein NorD [Microvirga guangxiensis]|uniref:Nitric oxide reductase NorD protein n=1 Tax=Microvirga guangxiensis TaxID=549386 RepID=A0A1G5LNG7_9HYPH|nr:VWA domain-containing protein [Microvirga guangxiensis]SCZ13780.1 nitric oxide reductase NorD protein [Microvirga guangxiensis]